MLEAFVTIVKALWPFLKESLFEGLPLRQWLRRHRRAVFWLVMLMIMLLVELFLVDTVITMRADETYATKQLVVVQAEHDALKSRYSRLENDLDVERRRNQSAQEAVGKIIDNYEDMASRVKRYEDWLEHCGVDLDYIGTGYPSCQVNHSTLPRPLPSTSREGQKFRETMRQIFMDQPPPT